jgi:hypothetical protein
VKKSDPSGTKLRVLTSASGRPHLQGNRVMNAVASGHHEITGPGWEFLLPAGRKLSENQYDPKAELSG